MIPPTEQVIQHYRRLVLENRVRCDLPACPLGDRCPGRAFRLHDRRERTFLYIDERIVHKTRCLLSRWKCLICEGTFTVYPSFALPYKRYVTETVCGRSARCLQEDSLSYRQAVREQGLPIFYEDEERKEGEQEEEGKEPDGHAGEEADESEDRDRDAGRTLQHSTLYRWLCFFASLVRTRRRAIRLIRRKTQDPERLRKIPRVFPAKYRSPERRKILQDSLRFFEIAREFHRFFGTSIFPQFATNCRWS